MDCVAEVIEGRGRSWEARWTREGLVVGEGEEGDDGERHVDGVGNCLALGKVLCVEQTVSRKPECWLEYSRLGRVLRRFACRGFWSFDFG